jgi:rhamnosyltransferase
MNFMRVSVIIPTLDAENHLPGLLESLNHQDPAPSEIIVVDTCSTDRTQAIAEENKCKTLTIQKKDFRHGRARNLGANHARGDILVFLTQDVLPVQPDFIDQLTKPIREGVAAASTARQIPYPDATPIESYSRKFNYPDKSQIRTIHDLPTYGIKTFFFSNSASAINRDVFLANGGFAENLIVDEDLEFCARLLNSGESVKYCAEAKIYHSHNYTITHLFQRFFDIGVFFSQAGELLAGVETNSEGLRYLYKASYHLVRNLYIHLIPRLIFEVIVKYVAFKIGYYHHYLPDKYKGTLSGQAYYWET